MGQVSIAGFASNTCKFNGTMSKFDKPWFKLGHAIVSTVAFWPYDC